MNPVTLSGKKLSMLRRRTRGKLYESPRANLHSKLNHLIGETYNEFQGRGTLNTGGESWEGDVVVLFFRDKKT